MGFDPPAQSDTSYEADALPPSHQGWIQDQAYSFPKSKFLSKMAETPLQILKNEKLFIYLILTRVTSAKLHITQIREPKIFVNLLRDPDKKDNPRFVFLFPNPVSWVFVQCFDKNGP